MQQNIVYQLMWPLRKLLISSRRRLLIATCNVADPLTSSSSRALSSVRVQASRQWEAIDAVCVHGMTETTRQALLRQSDLREPHLWYPDARRMRRTIVLHVGPTNSGKTHAALEALRRARNGMYCGPLRLLAWEVHERLNEGGTPCDLITGQERETAPYSRHVSCTVEMADISRPIDVAVLDEIQMVGDVDRGWAWTRVLLGAEAQEVHCCGDPAAVPLVRAITALTGDELVVRTYSRLSPLTVADRPLTHVSELKRGDVVVAFSRRRLYEWKRKIETQTGLRVGLIYGALPPAVRRDQARRFNGVSEGGDEVHGEALRTDVLCASDAVGMGLNLAIGRVVFTAMDKYDGRAVRDLTTSEVNQIGGRAGRFGSVFSQGVVCALNKGHLSRIKAALGRSTPATPSASLQPTLEHLESFAACLAPHVLRGSAEEDLLGVVVEGEEGVGEGEEGGSGSEGSSGWESGEASDSYDSSSDSERVRVGGDSDWVRRSRPHVPPTVSVLADAVTDVVPFSALLDLFASCARTDTCAQGPAQFILATSLRGSLLATARLLDDVELPLRTRFAFCQAPVDTSDPLVVQAVRRYASRFASKGRVRVGLKLPSAPPSTPWELEELESAHAVFDLYTWLARKFPVEFTQVAVAQAGAARTQLLITEGLERIGQAAVRQGRQRAAAEARALEKREKRGQDGKTSPRQGRRDDDAVVLASDYLRSMLDLDEAEEGEGPEGQGAKGGRAIGPLGRGERGTWPHAPAEPSRGSSRKQHEERKAERKAEQKAARGQRKLAESMMYAAATQGRLATLTEDPQWQAVMSNIQSRKSSKRGKKGQKSERSSSRPTRSSSDADAGWSASQWRVLDTPLTLIREVAQGGSPRPQSQGP